MAKNIGICQLFQKEEELVKAHIIPKWVFMDMKGDSDYLVVIDSEKNYRKISRIGIYDRNILSREAEDRLEKFDDYASQFFREPIPRNINKQIENNIECGWYEIQDFDYEKLKLFVISVIWRASISERDEWRLIKIEPKYEELVRQAILNCDCEAFPMAILRYFPSKKIKDGKRLMFNSLEEVTIDNINFITLKILDWQLLVKIDERPMSLCGLEEAQLRKEPPLIISILPFEKRSDYKQIEEAINSHPAFQG